MSDFLVERDGCLPEGEMRVRLPGGLLQPIDEAGDVLGLPHGSSILAAPDVFDRLAARPDTVPVQ